MRRPFLMVIAAWSAFGAGDATAAHDWLRRAAAVVDGDTRCAPGLCAARVALATARCFIAPAGSVEQSSEVAQLDGDIGCDETRAVASLELGVAALVAGDVDDARRRLTAGANTHAEHPLAAANCLALLALLEIEQGRWTRTVQPTAQARSLLGDAEAVPGAAVVLAVDVLVKAHAGDADGLDAERQRCREHLEQFCGLTPWVNLLARVALARAAVLCGDHVEAATMIRQSREMLRAMRGARHVVEQLDDVGLQLTGGRAEARFGPSSLTTAELRVLRLLPTHLTVPEIAHRLCVSRFTVKSQTSSIYRKLGTTTRSGTVEAATTFGLLPSVLTAR